MKRTVKLFAVAAATLALILGTAAAASAEYHDMKPRTDTINLAEYYDMKPRP